MRYGWEVVRELAQPLSCGETDLASSSGGKYFRGHQLERHPRQSCHHHAQGHPAGRHLSGFPIKCPLLGPQITSKRFPPPQLSESRWLQVFIEELLEIAFLFECIVRTLIVAQGRTFRRQFGSRLSGRRGNRNGRRRRVRVP